MEPDISPAPEMLSREDALDLQLARADMVNAQLRFQVVGDHIAHKHAFGALDQFGFGGPGEVKILRAK